MPLSAALEEAYASVDQDGDVWTTIQIDHVTLPGPLRFVQGVPVKDVFETMSFPIEVGGDPVSFTVADFGFVRPSQEEGGPGRGKIRIDNVSRHLQPVLRAAVQSDQPITVIYRVYHSTDTVNPETYSGLNLGNVALTALSATGDLYYQEVELQAFPRKTYTIELFPALFGQ